MNRFHVYSVANDEKISRRDLESSPEIANRQVSLSVLWNERSASSAYAREFETAEAEFLIFAHQDIYLPRGWFNALDKAIEHLQKIDEKWAVIGLYGVTHEGIHVGHIWDSGLGRVLGEPFSNPVRVTSIDEIVLIVRRASKVRFDPALPSFHLYGTDIVLNAEMLGESAYVVDVPVIHNSKAIRRLGSDYVMAYRFMVRKWAARLPWPTVIHPLRNNPFPLIFRRMRIRYKAIFRSSTLFEQLANPAAKARELGFDGR
jgi:hypothetical protein